MNRRDLLALIGAALLACGDAPPPVPLAPRAHLDAARAVGRACLAGGLAADRRALQRAVLGGFSGTDPAAFTAHLRARHEADLAAGRTRRADGWLLSDTEARLYAWLALG